MSLTKLIRDMTNAGAPIEAVMIAVAAIEESQREANDLRQAEAAERKKKAEQKKRERDLSRDIEATVARQGSDIVATVEATVASDVATEPSSPLPPKRYNQTPITPSSLSVRARARDAFEDFWALYPHKTGKPVAERAFEKLFREFRGDVSGIMSGLDRYVRNKAPDRSWLNPATFLNQHRFNDEPAATPPPRAGPSPRSSDGLDEARRMLKARHEPSRDIPEERRPNAAEPGDVRPRQGSGWSDRDDSGGQLLDLLPVRSHAGTTWRS